jgi:hypothetical protein
MRQRGHSRLVYDKKRRTIITVTTPWWKRIWFAVVDRCTRD